MLSFAPSRPAFRSLLPAALCVASTLCLAAGPAASVKTASQPRPGVAAARPGQKAQNQEHLAQWMERHSNLPLDAQQKALQREPGFRDLPPQTQERMMQRLTQLNNMSPEQRRRVLERTEAMEHLTPPQRQQVRGAMQQLSSLPVDRRRLVARAFRDLREMPPAQQQTILASDRFRGQFSDQERGTLSSLLAVEPYLPVQRPNENTEMGKQ